MGIKIEEKAREWLKPYPNNPRKNDKAVDAVAASIREFGFKVPIIADKDGVIIAGHTRLKAAEKLGLETVPVIVASDLTEEQAKALRLADNKSAEIAEWDEEALLQELKEITGFDMAVFGFELEDNASIFEDQPDDQKEDTIPESRLTFFSVSVFGMDSECFLDIKIPEEDAERIAHVARENSEAVGQKILEVLRGL